MMPAVVVIATVELPCAVFRMAEIRNGKKMPTEERKAALAFMNSTKPAAVMTLPSTPPAAVTKRIGPTVFSVSSVMAAKRFIVCVLTSRRTASSRPTVSAMIGVAKNLQRTAEEP